MKKLPKKNMKKGHKGYLHRTYAFIHSWFAKKQSGFTLIEMMVTTAIMTILGLVGLFIYANYVKGAHDWARLMIAKQIEIQVAAISTVAGAPTPQQLQDFIEEEGVVVGYIAPEDTVLSFITESFSRLLGVPNALALPSDPGGGRAVCLNSYGEAVMVCQFVYYRFSDGTYAISYGVEKEKNLVNPHYSSAAGNNIRIYGSFIGNSTAITIASTTEDIEDEVGALIGITVEEASALSAIPEGTTNGAGQHDPEPEPELLVDGASCTSSGECNSGVCGYNQDNELICTYPKPDGGFPCDNTDQCESGVCNIHNVCGAYMLPDGVSCTSSSECTSGVCGWNYSVNSYSEKVCTNLQINGGGACDDNEQCESGVCGTNNACGVYEGGACNSSADCQGPDFGCSGGICMLY